MRLPDSVTPPPPCSVGGGRYSPLNSPGVSGVNPLTHGHWQVLGWPESSFGVFHNILWKNANFLANPIIKIFKYTYSVQDTILYTLNISTLLNLTRTL